MSIFSKNIKQLNSEEYEKLTKKIIDLNSLIEEVRSKLSILETNYHSMRGMINRRIGKHEEEEENEGLNNPVILRDNGLPFKNR